MIHLLLSDASHLPVALHSWTDIHEGSIQISSLHPFICIQSHPRKLTCCSCILKLQLDIVLVTYLISVVRQTVFFSGESIPFQTPILWQYSLLYLLLYAAYIESHEDEQMDVHNTISINSSSSCSWRAWSRLVAVFGVTQPVHSNLSRILQTVEVAINTQISS